MLSYQHEYHAGNFADVFKHTCLTMLLDALGKKEKPYTVIDTHAGAGIFPLDDVRLVKTGEAARGIERLWALYKAEGAEKWPAGVRRYIELEAPYLERRLYAGSAALECALKRASDTVHLIELHPAALAALRKNITDSKAFVHDADSLREALALTPPLSKRGLLFCDPSYEDKSDFGDVRALLEAVRKRWSAAICALWYPILEGKQDEVDALVNALESFCAEGKAKCDVARGEIHIMPRADDAPGASHLTGCGMLVMRAPWGLQDEMMSCAHFIEGALAER